ncbi:MAG TPA: ABC transporter permease [Pyrinomonadaceae bacterium]|nr:ABC transporter permease [Pyrinomonadaceae bacterium]
MPYELFLALRYLRMKEPRRLARVTALAAILGVACGVAALIVALALANGFRDEMREKILRGTAHISLMRADGGQMADYRNVIERVKSVSGVRDAAATTYDGALLSGESGSAYAVLRGVDRDSPRVVEEIRRTMIEGSIEPLLSDHVGNGAPASSLHAQAHESPTDSTFSSNDENLPAMILGSELAARTGLHMGDVGQLVSGEATLTPLGLAPRYRRIRVAGIFRSGLYEYDASWAYVSLSVASSFSGNRTSVAASVIGIEVADIYDVARVSEGVRSSLGPAFTTVDWQEANRPLFAALALERRMGTIALALIILVATLNITTMLVLLVVERRADIAILGAMGARAQSIMAVFVIEGAIIGGTGAIAGILIGLAASLAGNRYKLVSLPADVYSLSNIPFRARTTDVALAAIVALILSLLATLYPARAAARIRPAEALRDG